MAIFSETETKIRELFAQCRSFPFEEKVYEVIMVGKPRPASASGECKTDLYILAKHKEQEKEFKISIKQHDADFLENKISLARAIEIFGSDAQDIIKESVLTIKSAFEDDYLIYFTKHKGTDAKSIKLGWKFELLNKPGGGKSGLILLSDNQKMDVYSGTNLSDSKKHAKINGQVVQNSGIANYILYITPGMESLEYCVNNLQDIQVVTKQNIYFACKALNYRARAEKSKWDGDRPLSVYVDWKLEKEQLSAELIYDNPLSTKGNAVGNNLKAILSKLHINANNFDELRKYCKNIEVYG